MERVTRFGVSLDSELLDRFDKFVKRKGYANRSKAIESIIRDYLIQSEWEMEEKEVAGTITMVYNHEKTDLVDILTDIQHQHRDLVVSSMHVHLDEHNCLEVLATRGKSSDIREIADKLICTKGVKHGKLIITTTGH